MIDSSPETARGEDRLVGSDRVLVVLRVLAEHPEGIGLEEMAKAVGSPKPTAHRALAALRRAGFASQDGRGRYVLGDDFLRLAFAHHEARPDHVRIRPALVRLAARFGETAHYAVLDGREVVYRAKVDPPSGAVRLTSTVGGRNPAHNTGVGKLLLAWALPDDAAVTAWVDQGPAGAAHPAHQGERGGTGRGAGRRARARLRGRRPGERGGRHLPGRARLPDLLDQAERSGQCERPRLQDTAALAGRGGARDPRHPQGAMMTVHPLSTETYALAEGPVWDPVAERLLWVDIPTGRVMEGAFDGDLTVTATHTLPCMVGAVVPAADGSLLTAAEYGFATLGPDLAMGPRVLSDGAPSRLNDGACDPAGRFLAGGMARDDRRGQERLYRLELDGSVSVVAEGLTISNGLGWSPDGRTFYNVDSVPGVVWARPYDVESGETGAPPRDPAVWTTGCPTGWRWTWRGTSGSRSGAGARCAASHPAGGCCPR
ncbi:hypothetical protein GCM10020219_043940 [Nonomuraea dietziae]